MTTRKNDGTLWLCQDYRALNRCMRTDSGGSGNLLEMFQRLGRNSWFTSIDVASGFFQLPIVEEDRHKAAFRMRSGSCGSMCGAALA